MPDWMERKYILDHEAAQGLWGDNKNE
jgi:hypothetical protein